MLTIAGVGWDASRPVPWRRLTREWLIYAGIMTVVFAVLLRGGVWPIIGGLLASGPLYLSLGYVLAKFGYQRKTLAEMRTPRAEPHGTATTRAGSPPASGADPPHLDRPQPAGCEVEEAMTPATCVIAIDAGTTGIRSRSVPIDGSPGVSAYREFTQHFPRPGWVEHDAVEIWDAARATLVEVVERAGAASVAAIGITNQRETVVAWDRSTGRPYGHAIVWQDRRTAQRCDELAEQGALDLVRRRTGLVLDPYFSGTKFEWLLGDGGVPVSDDLALGTVDTWLIWNLTGGEVFATDSTNASRTMLFDIGAAGMGRRALRPAARPDRPPPGRAPVERTGRRDVRPLRRAGRHPGQRHRR